MLERPQTKGSLASESETTATKTKAHVLGGQVLPMRVHKAHHSLRASRTGRVLVP